MINILSHTIPEPQTPSIMWGKAIAIVITIVLDLSGVESITASLNFHSLEMPGNGMTTAAQVI